MAHGRLTFKLLSPNSYDYRHHIYRFYLPLPQRRLNHTGPHHSRGYALQFKELLQKDQSLLKRDAALSSDPHGLISFSEYTPLNEIEIKNPAEISIWCRRAQKSVLKSATALRTSRNAASADIVPVEKGTIVS